MQPFCNPKPTNNTLRVQIMWKIFAHEFCSDNQMNTQQSVVGIEIAKLVYFPSPKACCTSLSHWKQANVQNGIYRQKI